MKRKIVGYGEADEVSVGTGQSFGTEEINDKISIDGQTTITEIGNKVILRCEKCGFCPCKHVYQDKKGDWQHHGGQQ